MIQPRLIREVEGLEHSPSVRMSMPSQRPRFLGSLAKRVGASKSVPPERTRLMLGLDPFFHSTMSFSATVQSKGRMVTETRLVSVESSPKNRESISLETEPDWSTAMRSLAV